MFAIKYPLKFRILSRLTSKDSEASAGQSPLPPPGPFVTPMAQARFAGIQPKFAALLKQEYKPTKNEEKNWKKGKKTEDEEKMEEDENDGKVAVKASSVQPSDKSTEEMDEEKEDKETIEDTHETKTI